ncbi:MAG: efflux RND transporter periplasmic adaptor subunit [Bacteroidota bacterium]
MRNIFPILALVFLAVACQAPAVEGEMPESLADKQALLREKQTALKQLTDEITSLEAAIAEQDPTVKEKGVLVTIMPVERTDFSSYASLQGSVMAEDMIDATAEIAGRILQMSIKEGDNIRKGQLVAVLDVEAFETQRAELETALELATTVYERQKRLWDQNIGSEIQFLQAKNNKERTEKGLASLDVQLAKNKVYAPASGVVERVILQAGELASPGMPILQILNTSQLKVAADVPESYIRSVRRGEKVMVNIPALAMERQVSVSLVGKTVDPANRTFKVEAKLPNDPLLKPNLLAEMKITDFMAKDVVVVQQDRVQQEVSGQRYVFIAEEGPEGFVARKQNITTGENYDGEVIVTEGLSGKESLIMEGSRGLADGQLIEIITQKADK